MNTVLVRQGTKYSNDYVRILNKSLSKYAKPPITLTDQKDTYGRTRMMETNFTGWWSKIELFAPWMEDLRPCLFIDLDTLILKPIHDFLEPVNELYLIRDFFNPDRSNSGLMLIPKDTTEIWANAARWTRDKADGNFLNTQPHVVMQDKFDGIKSFKAHKDYRDARILCFHGKPKPHDCGDQWIKTNWR